MGYPRARTPLLRLRRCEGCAPAFQQCYAKPRAEPRAGKLLDLTAHALPPRRHHREDKQVSAARSQLVDRSHSSGDRQQPSCSQALPMPSGLVCSLRDKMPSTMPSAMARQSKIMSFSVSLHVQHLNTGIAFVSFGQRQEADAAIAESMSRGPGFTLPGAFCVLEVRIHWLCR